MLFLSYQPMLKREGQYKDEEDMLVGEVRTEAILHRHECLLNELGYVPYWAVGGETVDDIIINSINCAPNNGYMAWLFETDEYIRIDKVKWYESIMKREDKNPLEFRNDDLDDLHSEFLVKSFSKRIAMVPLMMFFKNIKRYDMKKLFDACRIDFIDDELKEYWLDIIEYMQDFCCDWTVPYSKDFNIREECWESFVDFSKARFVFETTVLPGLLPFFIRNNNISESSEIKFDTMMLYRLIIWRDHLLQHRNDFTIWSHSDCSLQTYDRICDDLKEYLSPGYDFIATMLNNYGNIGRNDKCPCGSGIKYKKCHGRLNWNFRL